MAMVARCASQGGEPEHRSFARVWCTTPTCASPNEPTLSAYNCTDLSPPAGQRTDTTLRVKTWAVLYFLHAFGGGKVDVR